MTDKEIIIDGVNVAGCTFLDDYSKSMCNGFRGDNSGFHQGHCIQNRNCYFKQLQRKEQECEDLISGIDFLQQKLAVKEQECEELKKEQAEIKKYLGISSKTILERLEELQEFRDIDKEQLFNYKQALEKIEELANDYCDCNNLSHFVQDTEARHALDDVAQSLTEILDIINEVKDDTRIHRRTAKRDKRN